MGVTLELTHEQAEVLRQFMRGRMQGLMATSRSLGHPADASFAAELLMVVGSMRPVEVDGPGKQEEEEEEESEKVEESEEVVEESKSAKPSPLDNLFPTGPHPDKDEEKPVEEAAAKPPSKPKSGSGARQGAATSKNLKRN